MSVKEKLMKDMKEALKKGEKVRLSAIRLLLSQIKNVEIEKGKELSDDEIHQIILRETKKWEEAALDYEKAGNPEMANRERSQVEVAKEYLPEQLSEEELEKVIKEVISEAGAQGPKDMGKVMSILMPRVRGRADGKVVSEKVRAMLSSS
jgi:hypothetical protein